MKNILFPCLLLLSFFFVSCEDDDPIAPDPVQEFPNTALIHTTAPGSVSATVSDLEGKITDNGFTLVKTVNHAAAAEGAGLELDPTQVIIFGNPTGGTQLMQQDQRIGIDLPLKILVWEDVTGTTQTSYYNAETLTDRYDIDDADDLINNVNQTLADITGSGNPEEEGELLDAALFMRTKETEMDADVLYDRVKAEIEERGFTVVQEVNHDAAAAEVNMQLRPTRLIIFGNPEGGTQLMQTERTIAYDLPLKMLIWQEEDGDVNVSYYTVDYLANRYDLDGMDDLKDNIDQMLSDIVDEATQE